MVGSSSSISVRVATKSIHVIVIGSSRSHLTFHALVNLRWQRSELGLLSAPLCTRSLCYCCISQGHVGAIFEGLSFMFPEICDLSPDGLVLLEDLSIPALQLLIVPIHFSLLGLYELDLGLKVLILTLEQIYLRCDMLLMIMMKEQEILDLRFKLCKTSNLLLVIGNRALVDAPKVACELLILLLVFASAVQEFK